MKPSLRRSVLVALIAALIGAVGGLEVLEAQQQRSSSGRARVLVAVFQPGQGVDGDFGKKIAKHVRKRVASFDLLTPVSEDEVEKATDRFDLNTTKMDLISWRQLASRLNAQLIVYGEIDKGGSSDGYSVNSMFVEANRGDTTSVPTVEVSGQGGDQAREVARSIANHLSDQVKFLRARLNCQDYLASDQFEDAARNCDEALSVRPNNAQALYLRGRVAVERENWEKAVDYLSKAVEESPSHEDALQSLAYAHAQAGNRDKAVEYYREYLEFNPEATDVRLSVAYNLASADAYAEAMKILEEGIERDSTKAQLWKYLGDVAIRQGTAADKKEVGGGSDAATISDTSAIKTAVEAYQHYAQLRPDSVGAGLYRNMVGAYLQIGNVEAAAEQSRRALEQLPEEPALWAIRADVMSRQGKLDEAISAMDSVIALDSTYRRPYFKRGIFKLRNGRTEAALADFRKAVEAGGDPNTIAQQLFATGHSDYYKEGRYQRAAAMFETALEFAESQDLQNRLHFWAGYSYFRRGERLDKRNKADEACQPARRALDTFQQVPPHMGEAGSYQQQSQTQIETAVETYIYRQEQIIKKSC